MDQIWMFPDAEETVYAEIKPALLGILSKNGLGEEWLTLEKKKSYYSVCFNKSAVVVRMRQGKKTYIEVIASGVFKKIYLSDLLDALSHIGEIESSLEYVIDSLKKEFDCCHRFMECSDKTECTHPDKAMALQCGYRKILKSGRVFFGKNRNVK